MKDLSKFCCQNKKCPDYGKRNANNLPAIWEYPFVKHRLTFPNVSFLITKHIGRMSRFYLSAFGGFTVSVVKELNLSARVYPPQVGLSASGGAD
jgi:hypothetical protein